MHLRGLNLVWWLVIILVVVCLAIRSKEPNIVVRAASQPTIVLVAPSQAQPASGIIDIEVRVVGAHNLAAYEFDLLFDRSFINLSDITLSRFLGETTACQPTTGRCSVRLGPLNQEKTTAIGAYSYGDVTAANGDGLLATLHFQATGATGTTSLHVSHPILVDIAAVALVPSVQDATLILADLPIPTPTGSRNSHIYLPLIKQQP